MALAPSAPNPLFPDLVEAPRREKDPAWDRPPDPLRDGDARRRAGVIHREIPLTTIGTGWDVASVRAVLDDIMIGLFDGPAQLADAIAADSRVHAAMGSRLGGLLGRPVDFMLPRKFADSSAARECRDAFADAWPVMAAEDSLAEIKRWAIMLGFGPAQILWNTSGDYMVPRPVPWHPRYTFWHWTHRVLVAITQDGQVPVIAGDGKWILHAPRGEYRGWIHGAIRAIAPWWLARHYALRDWARYSERHGLPMIKAMTPTRGDPVLVDQWRSGLHNLGQESVIECPQVVEPGGSFDLDLLEAKDVAHTGFAELISQCDTEITLALLWQNLTTEVKEGSFAAARIHADVRQSALEADARADERMIYRDLARPFAMFNFGDPDLAPRAVWNVKPYEDDQTAAQTLLTVTQAIVNLRNAGSEVEDPAWLAKQFGVDVGKLRRVAAAIGGGGAPPPGAREGARARFASVLAEAKRLHAELGESTASEIEAEHEALLASTAPRRRARR